MNIYEKLLPTEDMKRLQELLMHIIECDKTFVGYPCSQAFDYSELIPFMQHTINNLGDSFRSSNYRINTHEFERDVVRFFAELVCSASGRK